MVGGEGGNLLQTQDLTSIFALIHKKFWATPIIQNIIKLIFLLLFRDLFHLLRQAQLLFHIPNNQSYTEHIPCVCVHKQLENYFLIIFYFGKLFETKKNPLKL